MAAAIEDPFEETIFTQYNVRQGIKRFGQSGIDAIHKEMEQLHDMEVIDPILASNLTTKEKQAALAYLMFLKEKRDGQIKGRGCADGRKQRAYMSKEDTSSPTVMTESVMISCTIDAKERRDVATVDIPGAFMQAFMNEFVVVKLEGPLAKLLEKVKPELYTKFVTVENGKPVIYVRLLKALYGTLQAALLFWKDLSEKLNSWGFEANPYDPCVVNKMIDGKQCTILWHVDDLKISHEDANVVTSIIELLDGAYGSEKRPLTVMRRKILFGNDARFQHPGKSAHHDV